MVAILSLLIVLLLSLVVVRVAAVALTLTGLSRQAAQFQARSAWTGTGFTTAESEKVINHPVRRRIINWLMFLRSAGLVTMASTLVLSFVNVEQTGQGAARLVSLMIGLGVVWMLAGSGWVDRRMSRVIAWALKRYSDLDTRDYADLLHLAGEYAVMEFKVEGGSWLAEKTLNEANLTEEGVLVLGIVRTDDSYIGAPRGDYRVNAGAVLLLYGRSSILDSLSRRRADPEGEQSRRAAVDDQRRVTAEEDSDDAAPPVGVGQTGA